MSSGNKLNQHKSWNMAGAPMQSKVARAKEKAEDEARRISELRKQIKEERDHENLLLMQGKAPSGIAWMYDSQYSKTNSSAPNDSRMATTSAAVVGGGSSVGGDGEWKGTIASELKGYHAAVEKETQSAMLNGKMDVSAALHFREEEKDKNAKRLDEVSKMRDDPMRMMMDKGRMLDNKKKLSARDEENRRLREEYEKEKSEKYRIDNGNGSDRYAAFRDFGHVRADREGYAKRLDNRENRRDQPYEKRYDRRP
eukprot:ANDGO_01479.mRNA.1 hypothetical protein